jgi:hypothetical protein
MQTMRCPRCSSERVIVLVHSLRALCGGCMHQWNPTEDELDLITDLPQASDIVSRTLTVVYGGRYGEDRPDGSGPAADARPGGESRL